MQLLELMATLNVFPSAHCLIFFILLVFCRRRFVMLRCTSCTSVRHCSVLMCANAQCCLRDNSGDKPEASGHEHPTLRRPNEGI